LLPEATLGAPEAAHAEQHLLQAGGERRGQRAAVDEVRFGHRHGAFATRQGLARRGQLAFLGEDFRTQNHGSRLLLRG
jgi:hypothetical protein